MQSILISKCKKGCARHTSQELRGRATGGWRPSACAFREETRADREHLKMTVERSLSFPSPGFPTRSRGIGRVSTKVASHGRRSAEIGNPETGNGTRTTNRVALLRLISGRRTSGGRRTSEAALSLSNSDEWYCRRPANCRSSRGNRRLPRLLQSPSDFERGTARVERHRRALKRRDLNPSVWSYGIRQAVRKNKNPRCRSTGGS